MHVMHARHSVPCGSDPKFKVARPQQDFLGALPPEHSRHRILDVKQTAEFIGQSIPNLRRLYRENKMPQPLKLSSRKLGFRLGDLIDWLEARSAD
jgi:predicted DNA-binding transcriptional regulator AlpA